MFTKLKFIIVFMLMATPALAQTGRMVAPEEARGFLPHLEMFSIPAAQNLIAIAQEPQAWPPTPAAQRDRLLALAYVNIQNTLLVEMHRRAEESVAQRNDHFSSEFLFLGRLVRLAGREAAGKTGSVGENNRLAWFASSMMLEFSIDGLRQIIRLYEKPEPEEALTQEFARRLEEQLETVVGRYREAENLAADRSHLIEGRFVEPVRQIGHAAISISVGMAEESVERIRRALRGETVRTEELRRTTEILATYSAVSQPLTLVLATDPQSEFDQAVRQAEDVLFEMVFGGLSETECANQRDDDNDLQVDCQDSDCDDTMVCCRNCI